MSTTVSSGVHLRVLEASGAYSCTTFHCTVTPALCAARARAKFDVRRGDPAPRHPTCAACPLGGEHARGDVAKRPPPRVRTRPEKPAKPVRAPSLCTRCNRRDAAKPFPSDPIEWATFCSFCRAKRRSKVKRDSFRAAVNARRATCTQCQKNPVARPHSRRPADRLTWCATCLASARSSYVPRKRPLCARCHEKPAAKPHSATPKDLLGHCAGCRDAERRLRSYWLTHHGEQLPPPAVATAETCTRCHKRPVGPVRRNTRYLDQCAPCRKKSRDVDLRKAKVVA